jgi:putrescine transport system ATP-binding protein
VSGLRETGPIVRLENVSKSFGAHRAVRDISLSIERGEFFALLGPSGCGKTSLLRLIAGFDSPDDGCIFIAGEDMTGVPPFRRPVNMMFQSYALFPHMNVARNIGFGLVQEGMAARVVTSRVKELMRLVRLDGLEQRRPDQLSGGQKQRVALARALARRPKILLLDEPLAALDQRLREETQFELMRLQAELETTFIVVTHDQREAMTMAHRMAVMQEGCFEQIGTPRDLYEAPVSRYVAEFIGGINLVEGKVAARQAKRHELATAAGSFEVVSATQFPEGTAVTLAIRPERISLMRDAAQEAGDLNIFEGELVSEAYLGEASVYRVRLVGGAEIKIVAQNHAAPSEAPRRNSKVRCGFARDAGIILGR